MEEQFRKAETVAKKSWSVVMSWVGGITALIGLFGSIAGGVTWFQNHERHTAELQSKMTLAEGQAKQGEYQASIQTYGDILKTDSAYGPALDHQLDTAMAWAEDFHVPAGADQNPAALAAPALDQIMAILDSGLARSKGSQAADVQAHIGWAHWLNHKIALREFGSMDEQNLRAALNVDPTNAYANGMLGAIMLQSGGSISEAIHHFDVADSTGKARPFVRKLEFGALIHLEVKGARTAVVKTANEMRKASEPLDEEYKSRILGFCFDPVVTDHGELAESLTAVPADEAWATYLWLDDNPEHAEAQSTVHNFVKANLLELSGKRVEALAHYRLLQKELKDDSFTMTNAVNAAIARLSHG